MSTIELEQLKSQIEKMEKEHQIEILKIFNNCTDVKLNENKSGVYVNLAFLPETIIDKVKIYLNYVQDQEKLLRLAETQKEDYVKTFFDEQEESQSINASV